MHQTCKESKKKNVIHNQEKEVNQNQHRNDKDERMMELAERDFKRALINMLSGLKNMNMVWRKIEDV